MELQQSPLYATYIQRLGWKILISEGTHIFIRKIPFIGTLAKIQRFETLPYLPILIPKLKLLGVTTIAAEASLVIKQSPYDEWIQSISKFFTIYREPFMATKTIRISLAPSEKTLFAALTEAKRRAVRKSVKNSITIQVEPNITGLMKIKARGAGLFGSLTTYGADIVWEEFSKKNQAYTLLAYEKDSTTPVAGVLLLLCDSIAYYWIAGASHRGKQLFSPTHLVWESLVLSKKLGCKYFDFLGVWDERIPKQNTSWKGFTKFKEGFGGTYQYYPLSKKWNHHLLPSF